MNDPNMIDIAHCLFSSCENADITPKPKHIGERSITVGTIPDSILVETSILIDFTVGQPNHPQKTEVDTILAFYCKYFYRDGVIGERFLANKKWKYTINQMFDG